MLKNSKKYEYMMDNPNVKVLPIVVALIIGAFFALLNETLLNVALPTLMEEFSISLATVQWISTGFMLVMGIIIPISAPLLQWFSTRQLFISTMIIFIIGTLICALAMNFPLLLVGRVFQAIGTGLIMPITINAFLFIFPPAKRGRVMGLVGLVIMFAPAIGPTLSGVLIEYLGWRYLFITVIPFALFSILFAAKYLVNVSEITKPKIDILSLIFSTIAFGSIVYGFSAAGEKGFSDPLVYTLLGIGIVALVFFVIRQLRLEEPLIDLRVFRYPMFTHAFLLFFVIVVTMFASEIILPVYMQGPLGLTAAVTGLVLLPGAILSGILNPIVGILFDKYGPRVIMIPATIILATTFFMMRNLDMDTSVWLIATGFMLIMAAQAALFMPTETNGLNQLPQKLYPHGTAVISTLQPLAGAIGISVFISIMNAKQNAYLNNASNPEDSLTINMAMIAGIELVHTIMFAVTTLAVILSFLVYRAVPKDLGEVKSES
jgi:DHA2 family lincomycin resistance protein-like MFS transporter